MTMFPGFSFLIYPETSLKDDKNKKINISRNSNETNPKSKARSPHKKPS